METLLTQMMSLPRTLAMTIPTGQITLSFTSSNLACVSHTSYIFTRNPSKELFFIFKFEKGLNFTSIQLDFVEKNF